jgi:hypothetical protein
MTTTSASAARFGVAILAAMAATILIAGSAFAHPESEGEHAGGCIVTAEPGTIAAGGQFTVAGNFGGASIFVLPGHDPTLAEDATPDATTPEGDSFSVTFTATGDPGELTIIGLIEGSECGDTDHIMVTGTVPNTATEVPSAGPILAGFALLLAATVFGARRLRAH